MSQNNRVIIFGTNDLAQLALFYLNEQYDLYPRLPVAFTVHKEYMDKDQFMGYPVIPFEDIEKTHSPMFFSLFAPVADNKLREKVYNEGREKGYNFISYISPECTNYSAKIGENCFILEDNTIQPFTTIGNNVILWSGNHIGHHSTIEDNVFFTSHVVLSGHCHVKKGAFLGVNSTIRDGITIEENCIIGMGAVVTKTTEPNSTYIGSPAKKK